MGNNAAAGHVIAMTGLPQAAGFHRTLGQMMNQYGIQSWDPRALLQVSLQRQQELQRTSPLRFIQVEDGLRFYGSQLGVMSILNREKFVQMSLQLFQQKGLHLPAEEASVFYDVFDSIDLYRNAQLSVGELAGGLSSMFGGTVEAKTNAVFDLLARGGTWNMEHGNRGSGQVPKATLQEFLKPYVWCMVPPNAEVLRPILLPYVTEEIYNDMSFSGSGYITRQEMQRWSQNGQLSQGQVSPDRVSMSFTIIDRAALITSMALQVAWREYEEKYKLREYGEQKWQQNYGNQTQQLRDIGAYRYAQQVTPGVAANTTTTFTQVGQVSNQAFAQVSQVSSQFFQSATQGLADASEWFSEAVGGRRDSVDSVSLAGTRRYSVDSLGSTTTSTVSAAQAPAVQYAPQATSTSPYAPQAAAAPAPSLFAGAGLPRQTPRTTAAAVPQPPPASPYPFAITQQPTITSRLLNPPSLLSQPTYAIRR